MNYFLTESIEHLQVRYSQWLLSGQTGGVRDFVEWCVYEDKKDLHTKRNPDGKSYLERETTAIAELCADALLDAKVINNFDHAAKIIEEEIRVRLALHT